MLFWKRFALFPNPLSGRFIKADLRGSGIIGGHTPPAPPPLLHSFGNGEVVWIPALIGLGGRLSDYAPLSAWLAHEANASLHSVPFRFASRQPGAFMKTLQSGEAYLTIVVNKSAVPKDIELIIKEPHQSVVLFANQHGEIQDRRIRIAPEETMVIKWT